MSGRLLNFRPYDAEIEYLESQGGCSIQTGVIPTGTNITIKTKIHFNGYTTNIPWLSWFTAYTNEESACYRIIRNASNSRQALVYNAGKANGGGKLTLVVPNTFYNIEMYPGYCLINNLRLELTSISEPVNTSQMVVFSPSFMGRCYSFYMAEGYNILLDLIPVRVGNVGYMYDKVSGQLFGNAGTGAFILGPDKN